MIPQKATLSMVKQMLKNEIIFRSMGAFLLVCLPVFILAHPPTRSFCSELDVKKPGELSLDVKDELLMKVLEKLSAASGYEIILDGEWENLTVSVAFENATLEEALSRVLGGYNHAVIWDESEKKISLFIYHVPGSDKRTRIPTERSSDRFVPGAKPKGNWEPGKKPSGMSPNASERKIGPESQVGSSGLGRENSEQEQGPGVTITGDDTSFTQTTKTTTE